MHSCDSWYLRAFSAVTFALINTAFAQTPTPSGGTPALSPAGSAINWTKKSDGLVLKSDVTTKPVTLEQIIKENGLAYNKETKQMFERLNPSINATGNIMVGTRFDMIAVEDNIHGAIKRSNTVFPLKGTDPATAYSESLKVSATLHRNLAVNYSKAAYQTPSDQITHAKSLRTLEEASTTFFNKSAKLTGLEYSIAADRIDYANIKAAAIDKDIAATGVVSAQKISLLQSAAKLLEPLQTEQKLTRRVKIVVTDKENKPVQGLTVYSLPGPFFDDPDAYPASFIRSRLIRYSFPDETSPSSADVDGIDARVWVGPQRRFDEMVQLVKRRKLDGKFSTLNEMTLGKNSVEIRLAAPRDIVSLP